MAQPKYNTYVGPRIVPLIFKNPVDGSSEWIQNYQYEPLTIVTYQGDSYTSRQYVPIGMPITNTNYWVQTGSFNGQIASLQNQVNTNTTDINTLNTSFQNLIESQGKFYFENKKIVILGDSISALSTVDSLQPVWAALFNDFLPDSAILTNYAQPGWTISGTVGGIANALNTNQYPAVNDADIIIIFAGVNDYIQGLTLSGNDINSFNGALNTIYTNLRNYKGEVYFISPLKTFINPVDERSNPLQPLNMYRRLIYLKCVSNGWHYIDGYSAPLLNPLVGATITKWQPDGLHPNKDYSPYLMRFIIDSIISSKQNNMFNIINILNINSLLNTGWTISGDSFLNFKSSGECYLRLVITGGELTNISDNVVLSNIPVHLRPQNTSMLNCKILVTGDKYYPANSVISSSGNIIVYTSLQSNLNNNTIEINGVYLPQLFNPLLNASV